jgi:hypothetical protein
MKLGYSLRMYATTSKEQAERMAQTTLQRRDFLMRRSIEIEDEILFVDKRGRLRRRSGIAAAAVVKRMDRLDGIEFRLHRDLTESDRDLVYKTSVARREARRERLSGRKDH